MTILLILAAPALAADAPAPCAFCEIAAGTRPAVVVHRDDRVLAFMDRAPRNPGHVLVVPVAHAENYLEVPPDTLAAMAALAQELGRALRRTDLKADGINVAMNTGPAAGQSVFHAHLHVIPRFAHDDPPSAGSRIVPPDRLEIAAAKIRAALAVRPAAVPAAVAKHGPPSPEEFMIGYGRLLAARDRAAIARLYSARGTLVVVRGMDEFVSAEQTHAYYRDEWKGPAQFAWRDLAYRPLAPEVVVVEGGFEWTRPEAAAPDAFSYLAILVLEDGGWRIRSETEFPLSADATRPPAEFALPALGEEVPLPKIREICQHYGLHDLWRKIERDPPPRPFRSDGCTGWFDEWKGVSLYPAGFLHDLKYWAGYPGEDVERLVADAELMRDVARLLGSTEMAETMFRGVRLGGTDRFKLSFSWAFGRQPVKEPKPAR
ncbi:MAG TPA: HIT domain-containing protein [Opitutaceae bacterium]|nr:HIT domain-containing protein [Opitutaceae bacterium]